MTTAFQLSSTRRPGLLKQRSQEQAFDSSTLKLNSKNVSFKKKAYHELL